MAAKQLVGLYEVIGYRSWKITWPYRNDRYLFFGTKTDATKAAKGLQGTWPYSAKISEIKL